MHIIIAVILIISKCQFHELANIKWFSRNFSNTFSHCTVKSIYRHIHKLKCEMNMEGYMCISILHRCKLNYKSSTSKNIVLENNPTSTNLKTKQKNYNGKKFRNHMQHQFSKLRRRQWTYMRYIVQNTTVIYLCSANIPKQTYPNLIMDKTVYSN